MEKQWVRYHLIFTTVLLVLQTKQATSNNKTHIFTKRISFSLIFLSTSGKLDYQLFSFQINFSNNTVNACRSIMAHVQVVRWKRKSKHDIFVRCKWLKKKFTTKVSNLHNNKWSEEITRYLLCFHMHCRHFFCRYMFSKRKL